MFSTTSDTFKRALEKHVSTSAIKLKWTTCETRHVLRIRWGKSKKKGIKKLFLIAELNFMPFLLLVPSMCSFPKEGMMMRFLLLSISRVWETQKNVSRLHTETRSFGDGVARNFCFVKSTKLFHYFSKISFRDDDGNCAGMVTWVFFKYLNLFKETFYE